MVQRDADADNSSVDDPQDPTDVSAQPRREGRDPIEGGLRLLFGNDAATPSEPEGDAKRSHVDESLSELGRISLREIPGDESTLAIPGSGRRSGDVPRRIGRYRVEGEIARGGVGAIYKAHDDELGRSLAVKVLLERHGDDDAMRQRFVEEAQIGGQLQHPGIVPVHEMGLSGGEKPYFAMKLIKGRTLAKLLDARESPAAERQRFLSIFEHVCQTVAYAHARGVIHRDLKPSNVMVGSFGEVQVVDWGLAKVLARREVAADTDAGSKTDESVVETVRTGSTGSDSLAGSVLGTPAYMSPEQARGEIEQLDERADVFGLGAILCEILTGKPPYVGATSRELLRQAKRGSLEDAESRLQTCRADRDVVDLAKRCLASDAGKRPHDAGAVSDAVRDYLESVGERAQKAELRAARARMRMIVSVTIAVCLVLGASVVVWTEREQARRTRESSIAVSGVVREAEILRRVAANSHPADVRAWEKALEAIRRAELLVAGGSDIDASTRGSFEAERAFIENRLERSRLRLRVEEAGGLPFDEANLIDSDSRYAKAFRHYLGADIEEMSEQEALALIRSKEASEELEQPLKDWTMVRLQREVPLASPSRGWREFSWTALSNIANGVEDHPRKIERREFLGSFERIDVEALLATQDWSPTLADMLFISTVITQRYARNVYMESNLPQATVALKKALEADPTSYRVVFELGDVLREMGRLDEARPYALAARALRPDRPRPRLLLGAISAREGDLDRAVKEYASAAAVAPERRDAFRALITLLAKAEGHEFDDDGMKQLVATLTELVEPAKAVHPLAWELLGLTVRLFCPDDAESLLPLARECVRATARQDIRALLFLADLQSSLGRRVEAERTLREARLLPAGRIQIRSIDDRLSLRQQLDSRSTVTYRTMDRARDGVELLIDEGELWRYHASTRSPPSDWAQTEFNDQDWPQGRSGFGYGDHDDATVLRNMQFRFVSVYIRRAIEIPVPARFERLELSLLVDDACRVYLNGGLVGSVGFTPDGEPRSATEPLAEAMLSIPGEALRAGTNVLAIEGLNIALESTDFTLIPVVRGVLSQDYRNTEHEALIASLTEQGDRARALATYAEGRFLQAAGKFVPAGERFREAFRADSGSVDPALRYLECLLASGDRKSAEKALRQAISRSVAVHPCVWDAWLPLALADSELTPGAILDSFPADCELPPDVRALLEGLRDGKRVGINCGGTRYVDTSGDVWIRDRFYHGGGIYFRGERSFSEDVEGTEDDTVYATERWFAAAEESVGAYRVPVPEGSYRVTLHFAELYRVLPHERMFDVTLEGKEVLSSYQPRKSAGLFTAESREFEVRLSDRFLDIDFVRRSHVPQICGIQIQKLD